MMVCLMVKLYGGNDVNANAKSEKRNAVEFAPEPPHTTDSLLIGPKHRNNTEGGLADFEYSMCHCWCCCCHRRHCLSCDPFFNFDRLFLDETQRSACIPRLN